MKLQEGIYENLITEEVSRDMEQTAAEGLVCQQEKIDGAESPSMLANHIGQLILNRLSDADLSKEERMSFANGLIDFLGETPDERVIDAENMLSAVLSQPAAARMKATETDVVRPLTGFRTSSLFTGGQSKVPLNSEILRDIASADRISLILSFLKLSGLNLIFDDLRRFCSDPNHRLRIITTTYCGVTEAKAVERLSQLPNTEIRISYNTQIERLHAKSYIFERNSGFSTAYIGSSNLSKSAQTDGLEWNIRVTNVENPHIIKAALATFETYWDSPNFEDFRLGGVEKLYEELHREREPRNSTPDALLKFQILPHQKQILDHLEAVRAGGLYRNLVVAATGTGKTVVSAFDYKIFRDRHPNADRILFVAHRQEILKQSLRTYRSVLSDLNFGDVWVGDNRPYSGIDHLFVSVQTFCSKFEDVFNKLPADYYDYIVVDEAHHIVANSYRKILDKFTPKLFIGLTATPERMDGTSLLPDFGGRISAEIRLPNALDEGLLTPFQYLCISDDTDLSDDHLMQGNCYVPARLTPMLCTSQRVCLIIDRLRYYLPDHERCKALAFCATKEHARYMAQSFRECGLKADYLTSDNEKNRNELNRKLSRGEINYLFVVDIFNEGVDIPEVDVVLFLRPTESLTIFLQQLGRGLRLAPGKQLLTVFDFVAQLNQKYDYVSRFRSLMTRKDGNIERQVKEGFLFLPHGCTIHMEEKAQRYVLESIKSAVYNKNRLIRELRTYSHAPTLSEFIESNGQDVRILYKGNNCWSSLKREAGLCHYADDEFTLRYQRNIKNIIHTNSVAYLQFVARVLDSPHDFSPADDREKAYAVMLYYSLYGDKLSKAGLSSLNEALTIFAAHPVFVEELLELIAYVQSNIEQKTFAVGNGMPLALEQYGCYTREEVFAVFGRQTLDRKMQGSAAGVFAIDELNTELFFVTLNKSDKDFSPSTMYDDYVISESRFHWKSQNKDSHEGRGRRFVEQATNKKKFLLFVRENKEDGFGNTSPFYCFGLVDYISSRDDKPMSIDWRVHYPILPQFIKAV